MDRIAWKNCITEWIGKYKYVLLILSVGILLMTLPAGQGDENDVTSVPQKQEDRQLSEELSDILGQIRGVGRVHVMLTEAAGAETHYQTDQDINQTEGNQSEKMKTVIISAGGEEKGLVRSITPPVYLGAIVVCQGGDNPAVRLAVVQAVSSVTGIGSDRISVLKMK